MPADVLLTHSYHLAHDAKQWRKMQPYPPLGTLYAATALRDAGISVAVFDPMLQDPITGFEQALAEHHPRIVVIYEDDFNFVTKMCLTHMRDLAHRLAVIARSHNLPVIAHGSDATDNPSLFLDNGIDFVLLGEAEQTLTELCMQLLAAQPPANIPGLVTRATLAVPQAPPSSAPRNPSWSTLPAPARDLIDLTPYRDAWVAAHGFFSTNLVASRGCPFQCNWCAKPISGTRFQPRSHHVVAAEIHDLVTTHGVNHLWFSDDIFALDRHWIKDFADVIEAQGTRISFKIQSRADLMHESTVADLRRAGCTEVWMGVESGSQKIMDAMTKGLTVAAVHAARKRLKENGIRACYFIQFGYPGEGWPEIVQTINLIRDTRPDDIGISVSYPLPGTVFHQRVQQQLGAKRNWTDSDDLCTIHTATYTDTFYHALRDALHDEVRSGRASEALWQTVDALEPISRNRNVLTLPVEKLLPLASLMPATRTA
jgi:anaerobic magnesium-protoporphyrin IX monomethyl ester cyclase